MKRVPAEDETRQPAIGFDKRFRCSTGRTLTESCDVRMVRVGRSVKFMIATFEGTELDSVSLRPRFRIAGDIKPSSTDRRRLLCPSRILFLVATCVASNSSTWFLLYRQFGFT